MSPPDEVRQDLVLQWVGKANEDFDAAVHLLSEGERFRGVIAFHCQQAVEKYLKALLVRHQVDFPKTHDLGRLLGSVAAIDPVIAVELQEADALTPYGVEVRYPSDAPELLPGEEAAAVELARRTKRTVLASLEPFLSGQ